MVESKEDFRTFIRRYALTLEVINIYEFFTDPTSTVPDARNTCKSTLRAVASCLSLHEFFFLVGRGGPIVAYVEVREKKAVAAKLQELILSYTGPEQDHVWVDANGRVLLRST